MKSSCCGVGGPWSGVGANLPLRRFVAVGAIQLVQWVARRTVALLALVSILGCSARQPEGEAPKVDLLAVLPIERAAPASSDEGEASALPEEAGLAVTAQIYRFLALQPEFRFVADLVVQDAVQQPPVRNASDLTSRALGLGKEVSADAVIFGSVSRFRDRVGTEFGVTSPASVAFDLSLIHVASGEVLWQGQFTRTQEPLASNLFNFWMFWRAGPRWFSARELAGLGVDRLLEEMSEAVRP